MKCSHITYAYGIQVNSALQLHMQNLYFNNDHFEIPIGPISKKQYT